MEATPDEHMTAETAGAPATPYEVQLDVFEGPLDLLLFLIRKDELDVYDIPIAHITARFLRLLEQLALELVLHVGWRAHRHAQVDETVDRVVDEHARQDLDLPGTWTVGVEGALVSRPLLARWR